MPFFPTFSSPAGARRRGARRTVPFLVAAVALAASAAWLGPTAGLACLLAASAALLVAAVLGMRAHWRAALAADAADTEAAAPVGSPLESVPGDVLGLQLRGLQERTAEQLRRALEDGRTDLAREISDAYADDALRAITAAGLPPAAPHV